LLGLEIEGQRVALTPGARYVHIAADLRSKIGDGTYPVGEPLPSTAELMRRYEASNTAVRAAIKELSIEGLVVGQQGRGVYVQGKPTRAKPSAEFKGISSQIEALREALDETTRHLEGRLTELEGEVRKLRAPRRPRQTDR
jgi:GntR family transcriptional regulator